LVSSHRRWRRTCWRTCTHHSPRWHKAAARAGGSKSAQCLQVGLVLQQGSTSMCTGNCGAAATLSIQRCLYDPRRAPKHALQPSVTSLALLSRTLAVKLSTSANHCQHTQDLDLPTQCHTTAQMRSWHC
jgi:hypothetical protein